MVEQYWESRGEAPSEATDMQEARELEEDGMEEEDETLWADLAGEDEEDRGQCKSWTEELRAKKRKTEGDRRAEELKQVRDLGRVRRAAFDKKK